MNPLRAECRPGFKFIGELPDSAWRFCLVSIKNQPDVIVVADMNGTYAPRMIYDGKLIELAS